MLRNDVSKFRVRRSKSGAVQRLNAAPRRRRSFDALAVATFVAALVSGSVDNSNAYAQLFQSNASNAQRSRATQTAQPNARRGATANQSPLFSGKFARNVSEKFSRGDETQKQNATRRYAQTPERGAAGRSPYSTAPGASAVRAPLTQRPANVPNRAPATGYNAPFPSAPPAAKSADALAQPSTSRESAQEALAKIPWQALSPAAREKLTALAKNPTIYRRLPMAGGYCNPELFDFFLTHPHAVVGLWRQMGYDDVAMAPAGPNVYSVREKTGTVGRAQILYQDDELTLVYCSGKYQGPVVPRSLDGEMFLVLQTRYTEDPTGRPIVVCRLDAFVDLKNPGADLLARTFSGALGKLADSNFEQTLAFIDNVSQTAETNPGALSGSIAGLSELSPEARRLFAAKTSETARQAQLRARGTYVDYRLLPKLNSPTPTVARVLSRERSGAADVAIAARARTVEPTPGAPLSGFEVAGTPGRAGSGIERAPLTPTPSTFNSFDKPSLEQNSFALSDDSESDFDFEAELDWEEEETIKVGGARVAQPPVSAPTLVPKTSVAKATARPSTRFSDALDLVEPNANADETDDYAESLLAADEPATLSTDDESTVENGLPLLLDFENELLEETEKTDANVAPGVATAPIAKPAPLAALPSANAADAVALPGAVAVSDEAANAADASALPVLVFDEATETAPPNETTALDDVPLLLLPDAETSNATSTVEAPQKNAPQPSAKVALKNDFATSKTRGRVVAPIVPKAKKTPAAQSAKPTAKTQTPAAQPAKLTAKTQTPAAQPAKPTAKTQTPAAQSAPVWRAVEAPSPKAQVAPPIAETARAATEKGATFRKPEIH